MLTKCAAFAVRHWLCNTVRSKDRATLQQKHRQHHLSSLSLSLSSAVSGQTAEMVRETRKGTQGRVVREGEREKESEKSRSEQPLGRVFFG